MDMSGLFGLLFIAGVFLLLLIFTCIPIILSVLTYKLIKKKFNKTVAFAVASIIPLFCLYQIYFAIWPGDDFYRTEFKKVTGISMPKSGKIIRKDASYPGFTSDYCSSALIEFSTQDYKILYRHIKSDTCFTDSTFIGSTSYRIAMGTKDESEIIYEASCFDGEDYRSIGFLSDGRTVIIHFVNE